MALSDRIKAVDKQAKVLMALENAGAALSVARNQSLIPALAMLDALCAGERDLVKVFPDLSKSEMVELTNWVTCLTTYRDAVKSDTDAGKLPIKSVSVAVVAELNAVEM
jgi:hypothetical protein